MEPTRFVTMHSVSLAHGKRPWRMRFAASLKQTFYIVLSLILTSEERMSIEKREPSIYT